MASGTSAGGLDSYRPIGGIRRPAGLPPPPPPKSSSYSSSAGGGYYAQAGLTDGYGYSKQSMYDEPQARRKKKKRGKSFLEVVVRKAQKPEVILLSVWWLMTFILVVYMAEMGSLLMAIWKPLLLLLSIPILFFVALAFITL
eukprot:TRINITY_DN19928_c0_g1_i1.p2 TRINITY_DN19928_c0_g1~~TRINITY_DN19928_c0_g1_i1.p2  ORF type:complete len:142 (+),score=26.72 TRINITY_DN19928_c0_g1_i1:167-592(+)